MGREAPAGRLTQHLSLSTLGVQDKGRGVSAQLLAYRKGRSVAGPAAGAEWSRRRPSSPFTHGCLISIRVELASRADPPKSRHSLPRAVQPVTPDLSQACSLQHSRSGDDPRGPRHCPVVLLGPVGSWSTKPAFQYTRGCPLSGRPPCAS